VLLTLSIFVLIPQQGRMALGIELMVLSILVLIVGLRLQARTLRRLHVRHRWDRTTSRSQQRHFGDHPSGREPSHQTAGWSPVVAAHDVDLPRMVDLQRLEPHDSCPGRARAETAGRSGTPDPWWQNWWQTEAEKPDSPGRRGGLMDAQHELWPPRRMSKALRRKKAEALCRPLPYHLATAPTEA